MIRQSKNTRRDYSQSSQCEEASESDREDRENNIIHTFERNQDSGSEESEDELNDHSESDQSDLQISQSLDESNEDMDELEKRIRKLEGSLERNLKNLPKCQDKKIKREISEGTENKNWINLTDKSIQKSEEKREHKFENEKKVIPIKQQTQKIKKSIKQRCKKIEFLRQEREEVATVKQELSKYNNKSIKSIKPSKSIKSIKQPKQIKPPKQFKQAKLLQIQKQLQLLKIVDSLELKLRASINKKVARMHQKIEETERGKLNKKDTKDVRKTK